MLGILRRGIAKNAHNRMTCTEWKVYALTLTAVSMFTATQAAFAMVKDELETRYNIAPGFFGVADGASFIGRALGSIYIIKYPPERPKRAYAVNCYVAALFLALLPLIEVFPDFSRSITIVSMFFSGFFRSYVMMIYMMITELIDTKKHKKAYNIWNSLLFGANPIVVYISDMLLNTFGFSWQQCYLTFIAVYAIDTLLVHILLPEIDMKKEDNKQNALETESTLTEINLNENPKPAEKKKSEYRVLLGEYFAGRPQNVLLMADSVLQRVQVYVILMWFPYYFTKLGFESITLISVCYYYTFIPTTVLYESVLERLPSQRVRLHFSFALFVTSFICTVAVLFLEPTQRNYPVYVFLVCVMGFTQSGPSNEIIGTELIHSTGDNKRLRYYVINISRFGKNFATLIFMVLVGYLMELWLDALFYVLIGMAALCLGVFGVRKYCLPPAGIETVIRSNNSDL